MRHKKLEKVSFAAMFLSLVFILLYLAVAMESARGGAVFWEHSHRAVSLVAGDNEFGQCDVSGWKNIVAVAAGGKTVYGLVQNLEEDEIGDVLNPLQHGISPFLKAGLQLCRYRK